LGLAEACYEESLGIFRALGDRVNAAIVLSNLGEVCHQQRRAERAVELFAEALRMQRELDSPDGIAFDLTNLARVRLELGEPDRAAALSAQGIRLFRDMGNRLGLAGALAVFGMAARALGDTARAIAVLREGLSILVELDERSAMPEHLELLAAALLDDENVDRAVMLLGCAAALRDDMVSPRSPDDKENVAALLERAREQRDAATVAAAFAAGRSLPLQGALDMALATERVSSVRGIQDD
jgi:tetratricopeptide (TPR) repeat protein